MDTPPASWTLASVAAAYGAALLVIGALDALWLGWLARDFYRDAMGDLMRPDVRWGAALEHEVVSEAGDFLFVPPDVPHEAINLSDTVAARAVVARNHPAEQDRVVPWSPPAPADPAP